jgi:nucleotide-binding universal stress UspA family protein
MQRLLVATDLSAGADRALRRAILLGRQTGAALTLLYVVDPDDVRAAGAASAQLATLQATLAEVDGIAVGVRVLSGDLSATVVAAATELAADLILIGARAQPTPLTALTLSNTERLVRGCDCPVLVCAGPPSSSYRRMLVAIDFSASARAALRTALALGLADAVELTLTHVFETPLPAFHPQAGSIRDQTESWIAVERAAASLRLDEWLGSVGLGAARLGAAERLIVPNESTPARTLLEVAQATHAELIVTGCGEGSMLKQRLLGSVVTQLLRQTAVDVLVVPA